MANNQQQNRKGLLQQSADQPVVDRNYFHLRKGYRNLIVVCLVLAVANVLLYNTGWINWKNDAFDIIWATINVCIDLVTIYVMSELGK